MTNCECALVSVVKTYHMRVTRNFHPVNVKNIDNFLERYDHCIKKVQDDGRGLCGDKVWKAVEGCETTVTLSNSSG